MGRPDANGATGMDGLSFLEVLSGKTRTHRTHVFSQHTTVGINGYRSPYPMRAVRDTRYKLIHNLAPSNRYWISGVHGTELLKTWKRDALADPALARRVRWLEQRPEWELYDLQNDPYETRNRANDEELQDVRQALQAKLEAWMQQQGDQGLATEMKALERQGKRARGASTQEGPRQPHKRLTAPAT